MPIAGGKGNYRQNAMSSMYTLKKPFFSVRNLLIFGSVFSLLGGCAVLVSNVLLLDGLRKEQEKAFKGKYILKIHLT